MYEEFRIAETSTLILTKIEEWR